MRAPIRLYGTPIAVLPRNLLAEDYDIIHCNFPSPYFAALFALFSKVKGIPAVLTWHNDLPPVSSAAGTLVRLHDVISPLYLGQYTKIIATTPSYARKSRTLARYQRRVVVIPHGVDTARFNPSVEGDSVRLTNGLSENTKVVLFVGALTRWHYYKGHDVLINAFRIVANEIDDSHLIVVGGGELVRGSVTLANDLGLEGHTTFTGSVSEESLPKYYASCDLLVLPSRDESEGYGLVILEAMAAGKPVVGSRVGGIPSVIRDHETGLLVEPNNPRELAEAIITLLLDDGLRRKMGSAARRFAEEHDWERVTRDVEAVYQEVTAST
jgi:glycosyltransferase involved in cell wall biosynthesis